MKKYCIYKSTAEIKYKDRFNIKPCCTLDDYNQEEIANFNSKEEAIKELKKYKSDVCKYPSAIGPIYKVEEYIVVDVEIDEDGEEKWGDIWEHTEFQIKVDNAHYDTVATFGNFKDAYEFVKESDEELRIMV